MRRLGAPVATLAAVAAVAGCGALEEGGAGAAGSDAALKVTATTNIVADTAERIGGGRVEVTALMGPGVDPHLYRASAGDVAALEDADVALWNGLELESKMEDVFDGVARQGAGVVAVAESVPRARLLAAAPGEDTEHDPHVWFDPGAWAHAAGAIADAYIEADPDGREVYERNLVQLIGEIEELEAETAAAIERIPEHRRVLVTSHDAFRYFGRAFGLNVVAIQGLSTATEATTGDIDRVARLVADRDVPAVFVESSVPRQTIEAVRAAARQLGHELALGGELFSDAAGPHGTPEGTYLGMVRHNVEAIVQALR